MKNFLIQINPDSINILAGERQIVRNMRIYAHIAEQEKLLLDKLQAEEENGAVVLNASGGDDKVTAVLSFAEADGVLLVRLKASIKEVACGIYQYFSPDAGLCFEADAPDVDGVMANFAYEPWWLRPTFDKDLTHLPATTQSLLVKKDDMHTYLLPLCGDVYRTDVTGGDQKVIFRCITRCDGYSEFNGSLAALAVNKNPFRAVDKAFDAACENGLITVPKKNKRQYPEIFEYLGWCSWDALYQAVSEDGLLEKTKELREKGVPLSWIIIDDGWSDCKNARLCSFNENKEKFPNGLKHTISKLKTEYDVKEVGVWHAFTGYWSGIEENSELYERHREHLYKTRMGRIMPSPEPGKAFPFWNEWHSYLAAQGVDFVKVDNQSSVVLDMEHNYPLPAAARNSHDSLEASIALNFGGVVINCMGMSQENVLGRPFTAISRNSQDNQPLNIWSFPDHAVHNAYNSVYHDQMFYCDWDMFWTNNDQAYTSGVLRAISGGPVYVSDKIGETKPEMIWPLIESDGRIIRCERSAMPSVDCMYTDCREPGNVLKMQNVYGDCGVLAAFNLPVKGGTAKATVSPADVDALDGEEFVAYAYFAKKFYRMKKDDKIEITLDENKEEIFNFYPVRDNTVILGDLTKYINCGTREKTKTNLSDISFS